METAITLDPVHGHQSQRGPMASAASLASQRATATTGLYLIAGLCLLDVALVLVRRHFGHMQNYHFIPWNLLLACVPYGVSLCVSMLRRAAPRHGWLVVPLYGPWLLFLPNAPYLLTDFVHLQDKLTIQVWYDTAMLATYAVTGYMLAIVSLALMHRPVRQALGWRVGWVFVVVSLFLAGLGVHLGRAQRFNSWDILAHTRPVVTAALDRLLHPLNHPHTMFDALYYLGLLLVGYGAFLALSRKETLLLILQGPTM